MGRGLNTQFGTAEETTYGTPVTVDRFHPILSESLERAQTTLQSQGLRAGARNPRRRGIVSARMGNGDVSLEVATKGFGRFFKHLLGGTPTIAQQAATTAYLQTHQMGTLAGKSLTLQKGIEEADGVVKPFTFHGCKLLSGTFGIGVDQILNLTLTTDAEDVDTTTALATASYDASPKYLQFMQGTLKVAGSSVASVLGAEVTVNNSLKTDRFYLGSAGLKAEPQDNDFPEIVGSLNAEFVSQAAFYDRFVSDAAVSLILEFEGDTIASTYKELLRITVPEIRFEGETPKVGGPDVVVMDVPWTGHYDGTNAGVKIEYMSTDTAV